MIFVFVFIIPLLLKRNIQIQIHQTFFKVPLEHGTLITDGRKDIYCSYFLDGRNIAKWTGPKYDLTGPIVALSKTLK